MKFLKWLGIVLFIIIALFLIIPLFLPSDFHIEKSVIIDKPVDIVFQTATDMDQRAKWDPWIEMDPNAEMKVTMKPDIIGSGYSWNGKIIGKGKITIKKFVPNELIKSEIEFISPRSSISHIIWHFMDIKKGTKVTWAFEGELSYPIEKWMGFIIERKISTPFEKGLNNFKTLVESLPDMSGRTGEIEESEFKGLKALTITEECSKKKLTGKMIEMYSALMSYLKRNNQDFKGFPFAIYHPSENAGMFVLECGLPVKQKMTGTDQIKYMELPKCKVVMASHFGHYKTVKSTYVIIEKYIKENNLEISGSPWEIYMTDPLKEPDQDKWETKVYFPIK